MTVPIMTKRPSIWAYTNFLWELRDWYIQKYTEMKTANSFKLEEEGRDRDGISEWRSENGVCEKIGNYCEL